MIRPQRIPAARAVILSAALTVAGGCGGYRPVRWPSATLWVAAPAEVHRIRLPERSLTEYPVVLHEGSLSVGVDVVDADRAQEWFSVDLLAHGIQPLLLAVSNEGNQTKLLAPDFLSVRMIPARRVAAYASQSLVGRTAQHVRWVAWFVPGLLFSSIVEPLTTLDFLGMEEISARPARSPNREIRADFVSHELAPGPVEPQATRSGVVFVRRLAPDRRLTLTVRDPQGGEPVRIEIQAPLEPVDAQWHRYAVSKDQAWKAATAAAASIKNWRVQDADPDAGTMQISKGVRWLGIGNRMTIRLMIRRVDEGVTDIGAERVGRGGRASSVGPSILLDRFFDQLRGQLAAYIPPELSLPEDSSPGAPSSDQAGR